ncbi:MAG: PKD domain-containing protein [Anaerolineae bacterium]|nr:PKD domain-containing protein [Anaerolineae bacterium]
MEFNDRGVESRALLSAGTHKIDLRGFSAAVSFDAAADTLDIVLSEGELKIGVLGAATSTAILAVSPDSDMALAVHVGADGSVEHREIAFDEAVQRFSPEFRSLSFAVEMVEPVPQSKAESELLWIAMLDMDGDPATGQTVGNIMYSGLGADMLVALPLQEDGRIKGDAFFPADENISIPVEAEIAEDRRAFRIHIPLAELLAKAEALGISFAPDTLRWRFAAINHSDPDHAKDIYPELDFDFETGESGAPIPAAPVEAGPQPPPGVAFSVSVSIANGGPKAEFQDKTTSPDADNPIVEWLWDFGDGTTSTVQNPSHTYEAAGEYTATLTITFADGATMSGIVPIKLTRGSGVPPAEGQPCTIGGAGVNLRAGPGTDYDAVRKLAAGENAPVDGQTTGADGFVWWRLVEGVWARSDVVTETGGCESVPVVTP